jgi:hypothetical protein
MASFSVTNKAKKHQAYDSNGNSRLTAMGTAYDGNDNSQSQLNIALRGLEKPRDEMASTKRMRSHRLS